MKPEVDTATEARSARDTSSNKWGPVTEQERIEILDVLRGLAIFGILLANILIFAFPVQSAGIAGEQAVGADNVAAMFVALFVEGKFYTLFSLLFGMGLALQSTRSEERKTPFTGVYLRRLVVLLLIGVAHGVLLFAADILAFYALVALIALPFRKLAPKTLLTTGVALYAVGIIALAGYVTVSPTGAMPADPDWQELLETRREILEGSDDSVAGEAREPPDATDALFIVRVTKLLPVAELEFYEFMADEHRIFSSGTFGEMARHRAATFFMSGMPLKLSFVSWRVLALFLIGMYFARSSRLRGSARSPREWKNTAISAFTVGMLLQLVGGVTQPAMDESVMFTGIALTGILVGTLVLSLSYAAGAAAVTASRGRSIIVQAFAAVGRMALTNYLGQSLVCGFIFYSVGLGLFGRLHLAEAVALALPIFAIQLLASAVWLRSFRFGPAEWIWRTLSYGKLQPMRRV
jgi:uncharacterized protein